MVHPVLAIQSLSKLVREGIHIYFDIICNILVLVEK